MTKLTSADIGRAVTTRGGQRTRIEGSRMKLIAGILTLIFSHGFGEVYAEGYADPLGGAGQLSPADVMRISDIDPVTGKFIDDFEQDRRAVAGYYGFKTQWAGHMPIPAWSLGYNTQASGAWLNRGRPIFPFPLRRFRVVVLLCGSGGYSSPALIRDSIYGSPTDTLGGGAASRDKLAFQFGVGDCFDRYTNIPARNPITWNNGAANFLQHDYTANAAALAIAPVAASDVYDLGFTLPAFTPGFDFFSNLEPEAAYFATAGVLPYTFTGNNFINRFEFAYRHMNIGATALSGNKGKGGTYDLALDAFPTVDVPTPYIPTGFPANNQSAGGGSGYAPVLQVEVNNEWITVGLIGDSVTHRTGEGHNGSTSPNGVIYGDCRGSEFGYGGTLMRFFAEELCVPVLNCGIPSSGAKFDNRDPVNSSCRRAVFKYFGVTDEVFAFGINDLQSTSVTGVGNDSPNAHKWVGSTTWKKHQVVYNGTEVYYCYQGGAGAASGGPTGTGQAIVDGAARWRRLWAVGTAGGGLRLGMSYGVKEAFKEDLPSARQYQIGVPPSASSSIQFKSIAGQTPSPNWGNETTIRGEFQYLVRSNVMGMTGVMDYSFFENICRVRADLTAEEDSKWIADNTPNLMTVDNHPNSWAAKWGAKQLYARYAGPGKYFPFPTKEAV